MPLRKSLAQQALSCRARAAELLQAEAAASSSSSSSQRGALAKALLAQGGLLARQLVYQQAAPQLACACGWRQAAAGADARLSAAKRLLAAAQRAAVQQQQQQQSCSAVAAAVGWRAYHTAAWTSCGRQLGAGARQASAAGSTQRVRPLHWPSLRDGWSSFRSVFDVPYEYVVGSGYSARVAIINALYALHPHWAKMAGVLLAEWLTRGGDRFSWCYSMPVTEFEDFRDTEHLPEQQGLLARVRSWVGSLLRLLWLIVVFTPAAATAPVVFGYGIHRKRWLVMFRRTLERGGPAFIKWGQWAATRRDLFPPDMCAELEKLHTQAPAHDMAHTEAAVLEAFGFGITDLFSSFETKPVASGSIGQIHRAVLSDTGARLTGVDEGTLVAVKVRHPGVSEAIERDFALMMAVAALAGRLPSLQSLRLEESLKQFAAPLREQVDLGREAFHLHAFNYNFRKLRSSVTFPVPLYPLAAPQCLVETFESGEHISNYVARGPGAPYNSELAVLGARAMLHMMLVDNLIHADLHPGNILVQLRTPGGRPGEALARLVQGALARLGDALGAQLSVPPHWYQRPRLVLLDAGMATHLSPEDQRNMFGLFESFSELNGRCVADWVLRFSGEEQTCPDPEAFKEDLEAFFEKLKEQRVFARDDTSNGAEALAHVLDMVRQYQVSLPGHICATVVTTLVLEGWSFELDPAHSTLSEVRRITASVKSGWWQRLLMPQDEDLVERADIVSHTTHAAVAASGALSS